MRIFSATILVTFLLNVGLVKGQDTFPRDSKPEEVSAESAEANAKNLTGSCGFTSAFFETLDAEELLQVPGMVGVRFYIAKEKSTDNYVDLIAVAINGAGEEIGSSFQRKYPGYRLWMTVILTLHRG